jgi:hypothetical protein
MLVRVYLFKDWQNVSLVQLNISEQTDIKEIGKKKFVQYPRQGS